MRVIYTAHVSAFLDAFSWCDVWQLQFFSRLSCSSPRLSELHMHVLCWLSLFLEKRKASENQWLFKEYTKFGKLCGTSQWLPINFPGSFCKYIYMWAGVVDACKGLASYRTKLSFWRQRRERLGEWLRKQSCAKGWELVRLLSAFAVKMPYHTNRKSVMTKIQRFHSDFSSGARSSWHWFIRRCRRARRSFQTETSCSRSILFSEAWRTSLAYSSYGAQGIGCCR